MRGGFNKCKRFKKTYSLVTPKKVEIFHDITFTFIFEIYKIWTNYKSNRNPNLYLKKLIKKKKYDFN